MQLKRNTYICNYDRLTKSYLLGRLCGYFHCQNTYIRVFVVHNQTALYIFINHVFINIPVFIELWSFFRVFQFNHYLCFKLLNIWIAWKICILRPLTFNRIRLLLMGQLWVQNSSTMNKKSQWLQSIEVWNYSFYHYLHFKPLSNWIAWKMTILQALTFNRIKLLQMGQIRVQISSEKHKKSKKLQAIQV